MNGAGGKGPDLANRLVTGLVAGGVALACAAIGAKALVVLVIVALVVAGAEFYQALRSSGHHPATLLGLAAIAGVVGAAYWRGEVAQPLILVLVLLFSFLWYLLGVVKARPAMNVAVTVMAFVYIGFLGSYAALILRLPNGVGMLLGAVLATVAHDVGSYFAGRLGGRTPLAPAISPNKTFEGLMGGTFATLIVCLVVVRAMDPPWDLGRAFWLAVVVAVVSPLGDLCESLVKRDLGVKDMGRILPGHGGVLDRIDALLFVIPATYYLAVVLKFG
jgi:phosphatidate cytidylyltransferase